MVKRTITPTRIPDRLSYLWLAIAAALYLFTGGQWVIPLAAWLVPLFLLRFVRTQRPLPGFLVVWLVRFAVAAIFVLQGSQFPPGTPPGYYALVCSLAWCRYCLTWPTASSRPGWVALSRRWSFQWPIRRLSISFLLALLGLLILLLTPSMVICHSCNWYR